MEIRTLERPEDRRRAYPLMVELRTHLSEDEYSSLVEVMAGEGYELIGLYDDGDLRALAGIAVRTNLYYGRYLWVFDLVTSPNHRSKGFGEALLRHLEETAADRGCDVVALSSGVQRIDAHRFYEERMGYDRVSYVFKKTLGR